MAYGSPILAPVRRTRAIPTRHGFTLIEASLTIIIVGVGVMSMMQLLGTSTEQNRRGANMTTATHLAEHVREAMAGLSFSDPNSGRKYWGPEAGQTLATYDDLDDFDGVTLSSPIDSMRNDLADQSQYSQVISVWPVYANKLSSNTNSSSPDIPKTTYTGAARVTVRILYRRSPDEVASEVFRTSWVRVDW